LVSGEQTKESPIFSPLESHKALEEAQPQFLENFLIKLSKRNTEEKPTSFIIALLILLT
jgi:hypothetical protein